MADAPLTPASPRETRRWRAVYAALLAAFVALAVAYNVSLPAFEAPDEASHFYYAATLLRTGALPEPVSGAPGDFRAQALHEAFQPPLYYALVAAALAPFDLSELDAFVNRQNGDWSSDVCSSDLPMKLPVFQGCWRRCASRAWSRLCWAR